MVWISDIEWAHKYLNPKAFVSLEILVSVEDSRTACKRGFKL